MWAVSVFAILMLTACTTPQPQYVPGPSLHALKVDGGYEARVGGELVGVFPDIDTAIQEARKASQP